MKIIITITIIINIIIIAIVTVWIALALVSSCPEGWDVNVLEPDNCFYYIPVEATFDDAKNGCQHVKGDLVTPTGYLNTAAVSNYM